jgi:hypothetical protein
MNVFVCSMYVTKVQGLHMSQLGLRYIMKQIYEKHKAIWWALINAEEPMTRGDFIMLQDIAYLD